MKTLFTTLLLFAATMLYAQKPIEIPLWPAGAPNTNGLTGTEEDLEGGRVANVVSPSITVYPVKNPNGTAIIGHHEVPLSDAEQAIRLVRQHASEWGVDPHRVGIMGSSAGGHLAASLATLYSSAETRPDFQVLFYPVISMVPKVTHAGSRENLIGKNPTQELENRYTLEKQVNAQTPKAFIMLSADDRTVPAANGIQYFEALLKSGVTGCALHVYPTGGHGWGFHDNFTYKRQWTGEFEKWLREEVKSKE